MNTRFVVTRVGAEVHIAEEESAFTRCGRRVWGDANADWVVFKGRVCSKCAPRS